MPTLSACILTLPHTRTAWHTQAHKQINKCNEELNRQHSDESILDNPSFVLLSLAILYRVKLSETWPSSLLFPEAAEIWSLPTLLFFFQIQIKLSSSFKQTKKNVSENN